MSDETGEGDADAGQRAAPDYGTAHFDVDAPFADAQWRAAEMPDVDFYVDAARTADGPVLELGCGTGRVYLPTLAAGVDADGLDLSAGMLSVLRDRATAEGLQPSVWQANVTEFAVDREYSLVTFPFRGFCHLVDRDDQVAALRRVREALAPDGRFVCNFFAPSFEVVCEQYGTPERTAFDYEGERYVAESVSTLADEVEQVARVEKRLLDADGEVRHESGFPLKLVTKREFEGLLDVAGFSNWRAYDGFDAADVTDSLDADVDVDEGRLAGPEVCELVWVVEP
jgi:SAM-dependent methyltransferase